MGKLKYIDEHIGREMRKARKKHGYKQPDVAKWIGVNRSTISRKESGEIPFSMAEIFVIAYNFKSRGPKPDFSIDTFLQSLKRLLP